MPRWLHSSMKCAPLRRRLAEQDAVVGDDADRVAPDPREAAHQGLAVQRLELVQPRSVDDAADHLADVVRRPGVGRHDVVERARVLGRLLRFVLGQGWSRYAVRACRRSSARSPAPLRRRRRGGRRHRTCGRARRRHRGPRRTTTSPVAAFTSGGPPRKIVPCSLTITDLVGHRGDVRAAGGARPHDRGDLRDAGGRQVGLVEEDPAEVVAVGEDLVLHRQERAAGVDEIDARQPVGGSHLLRAQVLLHGHRVVGAALDGRVVGDHDALAPADPADAGDDAGRRNRVVVHPDGGERRQLEERRARVEQPVDPVADEQLAAGGVLGAGRLRTTLAHDGQPRAQLVDQTTKVLSHRAPFVIVSSWPLNWPHWACQLTTSAQPAKPAAQR